MEVLAWEEFLMKKKEKSIKRKVQEFILAKWLEDNFSKRSLVFYFFKVDIFAIRLVEYLATSLVFGGRS